MAKKPTKKLDEIGKKFGADREKALNDALKLIEKDFGKGSISVWVNALSKKSKS